MSSASTRQAASRLGGWAVRRAAGAALLLTAYPSARLPAQGVLSEFSNVNLTPSALQLDVGPLGGTNIRGTVAGGMRLDYGLIAPRVRVLLGVSYYSADVSAEASKRFEQGLRDVVIDPAGDDTIRLGQVTWSDVTADLDLQWVLPQGRAVTMYLGAGVGAHIRHGSGPAIDGTFVQDALNTLTPGLNGTLGAELGAKRWRITVEARGVLASGMSTVSLRSGVMYRWAGMRQGAGAGGGGGRPK